MKEKLKPYLAEPWSESQWSRSAYNYMASMRAKDIDISPLVDAVELSMTDADDKKHQYMLFKHLSNLIGAFISQSQADELERFFALRADGLDPWQELVMMKGARLKWFREDLRFEYLAYDDRFWEKNRAKMLRGKK